MRRAIFTPSISFAEFVAMIVLAHIAAAVVTGWG